VANSYKAIEVAAPGKLRIVERPIPEPAEGQVLIRVEAYGVCGTDSLTVEGQFPGLSFPRVPGHEAVGRIEAIGTSASQWRVGHECVSDFSVVPMVFGALLPRRFYELSEAHALPDL
jgi:D-arabinose 1-dehydrogenase-like Zn-dependent alcohol dehydrogenase